jgi:hypothetical protein
MSSFLELFTTYGQPDDIHLVLFEEEANRGSRSSNGRIKSVLTLWSRAVIRPPSSGMSRPDEGQS